MFLSVMVAIGLFVLRISSRGRSCAASRGRASGRCRSRSWISSVVGLIAIPVYLDFATAIDSLRSVFDVGALVPLFRVTAFGRAYVDMSAASRCSASRRGSRSGSTAPSASGGRSSRWSPSSARSGAAAVLAIPGAAGHAAQTSPRGLSLLLDWLHLLRARSGSGAWSGCWCSGRAFPGAAGRRSLVCVPASRTSRSCSVLALLGTGHRRDDHPHADRRRAVEDRPTARRSSSRSACSTAAMGLRAVNLLRTKPRLIAARGVRSKARRRRGCCGACVSRRGVRSWPARCSPPRCSRASPRRHRRSPRQDAALASVGPGASRETVERAGYKLQVLVSPNKAAAPDSFALKITKNGKPVRGRRRDADVQSRSRWRCPSRSTS